MLPDFIPNNHVATAGFREKPNLHRAFTFSFRPFGGQDSTESLAAAAGPGGYDKAAERGELLDRLMGWSFDRPPSDEALRELYSPIFDKIKGVIYGYAAPDFWEGEPPAEDAQ